MSFSATNRFVDGDISVSFGMVGPLKELTDLRGYGCRGFLLGRGGGMLIGCIEPSSLTSDSLTT